MTLGAHRLLCAVQVRRTAHGLCEGGRPGALAALDELADGVPEPAIPLGPAPTIVWESAHLAR